MCSEPFCTFVDVPCCLRAHLPIGIWFLDVYSQKNVKESRIGPCLMHLFSYVRHVRLLDFTKIYT